MLDVIVIAMWYSYKRFFFKIYGVDERFMCKAGELYTSIAGGHLWLQ